MSVKKFIAKLIATYFGVGFIPIMPGTIASIATYPLYYLICITYENKLIIFFIFFVFFILSLWSIKNYKVKHDHKSIVIDEVFGQLLTSIMSLTLLQNLIDQIFSESDKYFSRGNIIFLITLFLFRFYDIKKPLIIGFVDKHMRNNFSIILDDILAAIFSYCTIYLFYIVFNPIKHYLRLFN